MPLTFVAEHMETPHGINTETRDEHRHLGIEHSEMVTALNGSPRLIPALADLA